MKIKVRHYRVPSVDLTQHIRRGSPPELYMRRYGRGVGWLHDDGTPLKLQKEPPTLPPLMPLERGGKTVCDIYDDKDRHVASAEAVCSMSDHFNYRLGYQIALGRAMSDRP